ncbi:MAG: LCP family protein [Streptococcaceae bacterium]|jgi:LCP family protein required for cell wall assembly|nr:LCP family protein [Streptococcaceae bacterium]
MSRVDRFKEHREDIKRGRVDAEEAKRVSLLKKKEDDDDTPIFNHRKQRPRSSEREEALPEFLQEDEPSHASFVEEERSKKPTGRKPKKKKRHILRWILLGLLLLIVIVGVNFALGLNKAMNGEKPKTENFEGVTSPNGANNILILGTDQRDYQNSGDARSDSIMVLSLDGPGKKPKLISFMRDTLVNIPDVGPDNKINNAFTIGEQNENQGAELMRQTLKSNFGIDCKYYAMVNFNSFAKVIDGLFPSGVKIDAKFSTVNGKKVNSVQVPDDLNKVKGKPTPKQTIKVGEQLMDGRTLLNYARFRHDDENDFGRVKRQQQVLSAIISQAKSPATLLHGPHAIGQLVGYTSTDVPNSFMVKTMFNVLIGKEKNIDKLSIPEKGTYVGAYDIYGGQALQITDLEKTKTRIQDFLNK